VLFTKFLNRCGCEVETADNGKQAIELAKANKYALIFMDVQMPQMDGLEATRHLRALPGFCTPVIAITANNLAEDRKKCAEAGMQDFMNKPISLQAMKEIVSKYSA
jgi:two-component system, sensor histidine kinase and response regulator